jgi:hypothetical protein
MKKSKILRAYQKRNNSKKKKIKHLITNYLSKLAAKGSTQMPMQAASMREYARSTSQPASP